MEKRFFCGRFLSAFPVVISAMLVSGFVQVTPAAAGQDRDLSVLSLDELLDLEVVSVAKVPEKLTKTPAAISVITGEDLRRNGVRSIPDALRMVPGLHVYQIDANKWAVSARGFSSRFANKMLVMIDGRTVYSTLFSGVFWDVQDTMIEDIDRIEVIRGPGGTLWGANAVNGVINIITRDSADTQGTLVSLRAENGPDGEVSVRHGGWLSDRLSYRVYGKYFDRDSFERPDGADAEDDWHQGRGGFRMDMNISAANKVTLQGDLYKGKSGEAVRYVTPSYPYLNYGSEDAPVSGGNLLGRWNRAFSDKSEITFQAYYDRIERNEFFIDETLDTIDLDLQHRLDLTDSFEFLYGLGYRYTKSDTMGKEPIPGIYSYAMDPQVARDDLFSGFVQARIGFAQDRGELTLGSKFEHNDYTGFEYQPSIRALWNLNERHALWAAVSRSVRTPSRLEDDSNIKIGLTQPPVNGMMTFVRLMGNDDVDSETVYSYESGYRGRLARNLFVDLSLYYNKYQDLLSVVPVGRVTPEFSGGGPHLVYPVSVANGRDAETYGLELSCEVSVADWWRLTGGYSWLQMNVLDVGISEEARQGFGEDQNAKNLFSLVSYMDLPHNLELNTALYYVSSLDDLEIDSHIRVDLNLSWHVNKTVTLAAGCHNLFDDSHQEFSNAMDGILASEVPRKVYANLTMSF
jgi:iron complex outermembrane receptor protein